MAISWIIIVVVFVVVLTEIEVQLEVFVVVISVVVAVGVAGCFKDGVYDALGGFFCCWTLASSPGTYWEDSRRRSTYQAFLSISTEEHEIA